jgi:hypothetical protein
MQYSMVIIAISTSTSVSMPPCLVPIHVHVRVLVHVHRRWVPTCADTANVDYNLSFTDQGKQLPFSVFHLQKTNRSLPFTFSVCSKNKQKLPFAVSSVFRIYILNSSRYTDIYIEICIFIYIHIHQGSHLKRYSNNATLRFCVIAQRFNTGGTLTLPLVFALGYRELLLL